MIKLLAIDPGTRYTGYAMFDTRPSGTVLSWYGLVRGDPKEQFDVRALEIQSKIRGEIVMKRGPTHMVIEMPEYQANARGQKAAKQGNTLVLAYLVGALSTGWQLYIAGKMAKGEKGFFLPSLILPSQWKGQLPKNITRSRCEEQYGIGWEKKIDDNITDAIMLGDTWLRGNGIEAFNVNAVREDF